MAKVISPEYWKWYGKIHTFLAQLRRVPYKGILATPSRITKGFEKICKLIIDNVVDKNPADNVGNTPYQSASTNGHKNVCKLILDSKKPTTNQVINSYDGGGCTPSER